MQAWLGRPAGRHRRRATWRSGSAGRSATAFPIQGTIWQPKQGAGLGVQHRRHLRRRTRRRQDAVLLPLRLPRREPAQRRGPGRLVRREDRRSRRRPWTMGRDLRRDVRQLVGGNQDDDREGLRRGLRQAGRRHRRHHDRHPRRRALHDAAGRRQHDGAVGARADERARRCSKTLGLLERRRSWRWCSASRSSLPCSAAGWACALAWLFVQRGDPTGGMLPIFVLPTRDVAIGVGADGRRWACWPALLPAHRRHAAEDHRRAEEEADVTCATGSADRRRHRAEPADHSRSASARRPWPSSASPAWSSCSSPCCRSPRASRPRCGTPARRTRALVMRSGADSEMTSGLRRPEVDVIKQAPGIRRDGQAALASAELYVDHRPAEASRTRHAGQRADARRRADGAGGARRGVASSRAGCSSSAPTR